MSTETKHNKTFHLKCGKKFKDLKGLAKNLKGMTKDVFSHHVNKNKNDFSLWMTHSLKEEKLAKKINSKIDKIEIELEVLRHIVTNGIIVKPAPKKKVVTKKKTNVKTTTKKKVVKKVPSKKKKVTKKTKSKK